MTLVSSWLDNSVVESQNLVLMLTNIFGLCHHLQADVLVLENLVYIIEQLTLPGVQLPQFVTTDILFADSFMNFHSLLLTHFCRLAFYKLRSHVPWAHDSSYCVNILAH